MHEKSQSRARGAVRQLVAVPEVVDLSVHPRVELIHDPLRPADRHRADPPADVEQAFAQSGRRLLIVGEPGAGKTVAAYQLAHGMAQRWREEGDRVPVVVNLSAWDDHDTFEQFVTDHLTAEYGYGEPDEKLVEQWMARRRFGLVLDGLDEVHPEGQAECLTQLEDWLPEDMPVVVTCRTEQLHHLVAGRQRAIGGLMAVELQPLDDAQLAGVIQGLAEHTPAWQELLSPDADRGRAAAVEALRRPLILNLAVDSHVDVDALVQAGAQGRGVVDAVVIDAYLDSKLAGDRELTRWLTWIAAYLRGLVDHPGPTSLRPTDPPSDTTVFQLSRLTPSRVPRRWAMPPLGLTLGILLGSTIGLTGWLTTEVKLISVLLVMAIGLGAAAALGLALGMMIVNRDARPRVTRPRWPGWPRIAKPLAHGLTLGLATGLTLGLTEGLANGLALGLAAGLIGALIEGFLLVMNPQGRWESAAAAGPWRRSLVSLGAMAAFAMALALTLAVVLALAFGLTDELKALLAIGVATVLALGAVRALNHGGWFLLLQMVVWQRLHRLHDLNPRPLNVLQSGVDSGVLRQVGSGVRFVHNEVGDGLVDRPLDHARDLVPDQEPAEPTRR